MEKVKNIFETVVIQAQALIGSSGPPNTARAMKFPYTFSAKIAQFPVKFYVRNNWICKYYLIAVVVSLPVFYKCHQLANSEESHRKWDEVQRKEAAEHEHH